MESRPRRAFGSALPALFAIVLGVAPLTVRGQVPGDDDSLLGDHLRLVTTVWGFQPDVPAAAGTAAGDAASGPRAASTAASDRGFCAPAGSRLAISRKTGEGDDMTLIVRFLTVTKSEEMFADKAAVAACADKNVVNLHTLYRVPVTALNPLDHRRSGVKFGGLVVPFKFRLGSAKDLVSSSTVAPYVGFRTAWNTFGLTFTPVLAAGLSLVPIADPQNNTTTSKAAYTLAVGIRLTSTKNESFNAGLLFGRDFLSRTDRDADPAATRPWASFYLGYSL